MNWNDDGRYLYGGELQAPNEAEIINDLPYIDREQFEDIRLALAASHRMGRVPTIGYKENQRLRSPGGYRYNNHQAFTIETQVGDHRWIPKAMPVSPGKKQLVERRISMEQVW